jgi:type III pantothenate kinase
VSERIVVDIGNTRIKWGLCRDSRVSELAGLPPDDPAAWQQQYDRWRLGPGATWVLSGVHPGRCDALHTWLGQRGAPVRRLASYLDLPLVVDVQEPAATGIDRLLDAVAANFRRPADTPAIIIDAGSAVTVDLVDRRGVFRGGAIYPGFRLMARALHDYTALLPVVEIGQAPVSLGRSTATCIQSGIYHAVVGAAQRLIETLPESLPMVFLTGGDALLLAGAIDGIVWPEMTLEGILHAAP